LSADEDVTRDAFLSGQVMALQPKKGFRSGVDAVLLAAAVPARPGQRVLELGCGVGVASLCLNARVGGLHLTGVELQENYAELARQNATAAGAEMRVYASDLMALPADLRQQQFDHVLANPPYYAAGSRQLAKDTGRETALGEATPMRKWIEVAAKRLAPKGYATFIQRTDRLADMLGPMAEHLGSLEIQPLAPRAGRESHLVILRGRKDGRAPLCMHPPLIMHEGAVHLNDAEDYQTWALDVLRNGHPLPLR
jgi:tRNA1(Val) A37 N6-methylase TrmN6